MDSYLFVPGVKQEELSIIQKELGIANLSDLKKFAKAKKIRELNGLGSKTEMAILRGIKLIEARPEYLPIGVSLDFANILINKIKAWPQISQVLLVGDLRRGKEEVNRIEILLEAELEEIADLFLNLCMIEMERDRKEDMLTYNTILGLPLIVHICNKLTWGTQSVLTTGSSLHIRELEKRTSSKLPDSKNEQDLYKKLSLPWIPPEIRETGYEVGFAEERILPNFIDIKDIKGDLHLHSRWSDGLNTLEEIIQEGLKMGYKYLAITDHSQSLKVAGGLKAEDLAKQAVEISQLQTKYPQIKILKGIEVDILEDGNLDFNDDILYGLDIVIASIHSHFQMDQDKMTKRIIKALKNPLVNILAHPTGRILGKRPGYKVDINEVINVASQYNKVLEINASPDRLDLRDKHLQMAKAKGVKIAINTDAHNIKRMGDMLFGVQTAIRGWQERQDIINSWNYEQLMIFLGNNKKAR